MKRVESIVSINVNSEVVFDSFFDKRKLQGWWGVERSLIEKKVGGMYTLAWNITQDGFGYVTTGLVKELIPNKMFSIDNMAYLNPTKQILGPMELKVIVIGKENLSELYLCQSGYQTGEDWDWYYNAVKEAWPEVLQGLKRYLEKGF